MAKKQFKTGFYYRTLCTNLELIYIKKEKDYYHLFNLNGSSISTDEIGHEFDGLKPANSESDIRLYLKRKKYDVEVMQKTAKDTRKTIDQFLEILDKH